jgi:hypothetical protein
LFGEHNVVVENFSDETIAASLEFPGPVNAATSLVLPGEARVEVSYGYRSVKFRQIPPRTLVVIEY